MERIRTSPIDESLLMTAQEAMKVDGFDPSQVLENLLIVAKFVMVPLAGKWYPLPKVLEEIHQHWTMEATNRSLFGKVRQALSGFKFARRFIPGDEKITFVYPSEFEGNTLFMDKTLRDLAIIYGQLVILQAQQGNS